jgi:hypothetical protein
LCAQRSELGIAERWFGDTALEDLLGLQAGQINDDRLYRGLDVLQTHKDRIWVTLSPEPPGIFRFRLAPAGTGARADGLPVDSPTCRLQECIGARGASPQSSILRCSVDTLGQAHSSVEYWNKTVFDAKTVSGKGWSRVLQKCELFEFKLTSGLCSLHEHNP